MAHKYDNLAASIIQHVGGKDNIHNLAHCFTRLRFTLKDETKVNQEELRKTQGVIQLVMAGGQCQVVVGSKVDALYDLICQTCGLGEDSLDGGDEGSHQHNPINALMNTMSGVLAPTLGILTAAGIIKGLTSLFASLGWISTASGVYMLLYAVGDGFFYFLPILLGFSAARRFKCSEYLGAAIGTALVYPAMVNIGSTLEVAGTILVGQTDSAGQSGPDRRNPGRAGRRCPHADDGGYGFCRASPGAPREIRQYLLCGRPGRQLVTAPKIRTTLQRGEDLS